MKKFVYLIALAVAIGWINLTNAESETQAMSQTGEGAGKEIISKTQTEEDPAFSGQVEKTMMPSATELTVVPCTYRRDRHSSEIQEAKKARVLLIIAIVSTMAALVVTGGVLGTVGIRMWQDKKKSEEADEKERRLIARIKAKKNQEKKKASEKKESKSTEKSTESVGPIKVEILRDQKKAIVTGKCRPYGKESTYHQLEGFETDYPILRQSLHDGDSTQWDKAKNSAFYDKPWYRIDRRYYSVRDTLMSITDSISKDGDLTQIPILFETYILNGMCGLTHDVRGTPHREMKQSLGLSGTSVRIDPRSEIEKYGRQCVIAREILENAGKDAKVDDKWIIVKGDKETEITIDEAKAELKQGQEKLKELAIQLKTEQALLEKLRKIDFDDVSIFKESEKYLSKWGKKARTKSRRLGKKTFDEVGQIIASEYQGADGRKQKELISQVIASVIDKMSESGYFKKGAERSIDMLQGSISRQEDIWKRPDLKIQSILDDAKPKSLEE